MQVQTTIILLMKDSFGNEAGVTVETQADSCQIFNLVNQKKQVVEFDSAAYNLPEFCQEHGIEIRMIKRVESFNALWNKAERWA